MPALHNSSRVRNNRLNNSNNSKHFSWSLIHSATLQHRSCKWRRQKLEEKHHTFEQGITCPPLVGNIAETMTLSRHKEKAAPSGGAVADRDESSGRRRPEHGQVHGSLRAGGPLAAEVCRADSQHWGRPPRPFDVRGIDMRASESADLHDVALSFLDLSFGCLVCSGAVVRAGGAGLMCPSNLPPHQEQAVGADSISYHEQGCNLAASSRQACHCTVNCDPYAYVHRIQTFRSLSLTVCTSAARELNGTGERGRLFFFFLFFLQKLMGRYFNFLPHRYSVIL